MYSSPVRHSPPGYCYPALPFDLHVLGMPPAFNLSQDQTLHLKVSATLGLPFLLESPKPELQFIAESLRFKGLDVLHR